MSAARTLTDADVEALASALASAIVRALREAPANGRPASPAPITETMAASARAELERRGLLAPRRAR